jgi:hypothetical protein
MDRVMAANTTIDRELATAKPDDELTERELTEEELNMISGGIEGEAVVAPNKPRSAGRC